MRPKTGEIKWKESTNWLCFIKSLKTGKRTIVNSSITMIQSGTKISRTLVTKQAFTNPTLFGSRIHFQNRLQKPSDNIFWTLLFKKKKKKKKKKNILRKGNDFLIYYSSIISQSFSTSKHHLIFKMKLLSHSKQENFPSWKWVYNPNRLSTLLYITLSPSIYIYIYIYIYVFMYVCILHSFL